MYTEHQDIHTGTPLPVNFWSKMRNEPNQNKCVSRPVPK